jgi:TonB family protein
LSREDNPVKTLVRFVLCALAIKIVALSIPLPVQDARDSLNAGAAAFRSGNFKQAIDLFEKARQSDPNLAVAELYLASAYAQNYIPGNTAPENLEYGRKAVQGFESYLSREPNSAQALAGLAGVSENLGNYNKARESYLKLARIDTQNPLVFYTIGALDWIMVYGNNTPLPDADKSRLIAEGSANLDTALVLNPQYGEAMIYKNLLLREKAKLTSDPAEAARITSEADQWANKAIAVRVAGNSSVAGGLLGGIMAPPPVAPPPPPPPPLPPPGSLTAPTRVGENVAQQNLITRIPPQYPALARAARVQDYVMLQATIDKTGAAVDLKILHGHPLLNEAALDAVKQWRYLPFLLNGQPTDVITTITVNFSFQ